MKGLPDDRCYVIAGRVVFPYADRDVEFVAGEAFYTPPGHIPVEHEPGSRVVTFSPADELSKTEAVMMMKNMQEKQTA
jgi:mannose-6-phosphate isomerase-like protein (cupin superfamily)